jgi:hypothetical protein
MKHFERGPTAAEQGVHGRMKTAKIGTFFLEGRIMFLKGTVIE